MKDVGGTAHPERASRQPVCRPPGLDAPRRGRDGVAPTAPLAVGDRRATMEPTPMRFRSAPDRRRGPSALVRDRSGNVVILFALLLLPLIGLVGLGADYGVALSVKTKLDNAADAAVIAAVATAKAYVANNPNDANATANAAAAGLDRGMRAFTINAGRLPFASTPTPQLQVNRSGQTFTAKVSYQTTSRNTFGPLFGQPTSAVGGGTSASADLPSYLDFYLLIDVSGSMGLPSTADGQTSLAAVNPDERQASGGCIFACHYSGRKGWATAIANNIQLRSGAVNSAVCSLLVRAGQPAVANQYRVGLYPFVTQLGTLAPLTNTISTLQQQADCSSDPPMTFTNLLDTGYTQLYSGNDPSTGTGSGGTHFEAALGTIQNTIVSFGDGSSQQSRRPYVFIVTDGMQNGQYYDTVKNGQKYFPGNPVQPQWSNYAGASFTGSSPSAINASLCNSLKSQGATISVLYIPYTTLNVSPQNSNITEANAANKAVNTASPNVPTALSQCASPNFFYTANAPADITSALNSMFNQAVQVAHLLR